MDKQTREAREMVRRLPFRERMKHYWFYYRTHAIWGLIGAVILCYGLVQCATQVKYDLNVESFRTKFVEEFVAKNIEEKFEELIVDINGNNSVDAYVGAYDADITQSLWDQTTQATIQRLQGEIANDMCRMYILDKPYLEYFKRANYERLIESIIPLHEIPEARELFHIGEGEELYLVNLFEYEVSMDDEQKRAEHQNALLVKEYFESKLK